MTAEASADTRPGVYVHPSATIDATATIGKGTRVWHEAQVRERAAIGEGCIIGKSAYIDRDVRVGNNVKVQNRASIYHGVTIEDGVFVGPHTVFANDRMPRAINPDGTLKDEGDWEILPSVIRYGASVGAGAVVLPGLTVGRFALVGAGAIVTHDIPDYGLVVGNPARLVGYVCLCGNRLIDSGQNPSDHRWTCPACHRIYRPCDTGLVEA